MHPYLLKEIAEARSADRLAEAERQRLIAKTRSARRGHTQLDRSASAPSLVPRIRCPELGVGATENRRRGRPARNQPAGCATPMTAELSRSDCYRETTSARLRPALKESRSHLLGPRYCQPEGFFCVLPSIDR